jgi:hypothetical protein
MRIMISICCQSVASNAALAQTLPPPERASQNLENALVQHCSDWICVQNENAQ